jgi:hypothetical protein
MYRAPTRGLAPIPQRARMGLAALKGRRLQEQERPASESGPYKTGTVSRRRRRGHGNAVPLL